MTNNGGEWQSVEHALAYLARADAIPHRVDGEAALLDEIRSDVERVLDLGTGDGRLMALVLTKSERAAGVAVDFSPGILAKCRARFQADARVQVAAHDLAEPLSLGR